MKNIFYLHILIKGPQAMATPLASQGLPTKTNNDKYTAPLSKRDADGLQCSTLQHPPVFGKVKIFSTPVINISSNKTEIKNYLKYWNPMVFFLSRFYRY